MKYPRVGSHTYTFVHGPVPMLASEILLFASYFNFFKGATHRNVSYDSGKRYFPFVDSV